jgi:hypothetical protein
MNMWIGLCGIFDWEEERKADADLELPVVPVLPTRIVERFLTDNNTVVETFYDPMTDDRSSE